MPPLADPLAPRASSPTDSSGPPGHHPQILCLGDSFTFGWGVEADECYPALLAQRLGRRVRNLGVSGYGTDQELLTYRLHGAESKADWVILQYCGNDVDEVLRLRRYGHGKPRFQLRHADDPRSLQLEGVPVSRSFLEQRSALWRLVLRRWERRGSQALTDAESAKARELVTVLIRSLDREVRSHGRRLLVVHEGAGWIPHNLGARVPAIAELDLAPAMKAATEAGQVVTFPKDGHWTPAGHAIAAEEIAAWLESQTK